MKIYDFLNLDEVKIDNQDGWGAVPYNSNVDYMGLRVQVRPSVFIKLAHRLDSHHSADDIEQHIRSHGSIGAPFLLIHIPPEWFSDQNTNKKAQVNGHEGRNRMTAIRRVEGDAPVETHLFFSGQLRNRDLTAKIINRLNREIVSQNGEVVSGPWFKVYNKAVSEQKMGGSLSLPAIMKDDIEIADVVDSVRQLFKQRLPWDAIEVVENYNINVNTQPELEQLFADNVEQFARLVLDNISDAHVLSHFRDSLDAIGVEIPNDIITQSLYNNQSKINSAISELVFDDMLDAADLIGELAEWGVTIELSDVIDLEENKRHILKSIMTIAKRNALTADRVLQTLNIDANWPELEIIKRNIGAKMQVRESETGGLRNINLQDEQSQIETVSRNSYFIDRIEKPSEAVQLAAVSQNGEALKYIFAKNIVPSLAVQLAAVENWPFSINYILSARVTIHPKLKNLILKQMMDYYRNSESLMTVTLYELLNRYRINWPELHVIERVLTAKNLL